MTEIISTYYWLEINLRIGRIHSLCFIIIIIIIIIIFSVTNLRL